MAHRPLLVFSWALFSGAAAGSASTQSVPLLPGPLSLDAAVSPNSVALGDFDGDGKLDLAVTNGGSNTVSVRLGQGAGLFGAATNYSVGNLPCSVAVAELSGDGKLDLAVLNQGSGNVSVLLGLGGGVFGPKTNYGGVGPIPTCIAVGDVNGDDKLDLAVSVQNTNSVAVLLGLGGGVFGAATSYGAEIHPSSVAVGDLDADGNLDLAVANNGSASVSVLLGQGDGTFGAATNFAVQLFPLSVAMGDYSGDGQLDLAVANSNSDSVSVLLGQGGGAFGTATSYPIGSSGYPRFVAVADLSGDGRLDLTVVDGQENAVFVLLGKGGGVFGEATSYAVWDTPTSVAVGDVTGDGELDLTVTNANPFSSHGTMSVLPGQGHGRLGTATTNYLTGSGPRSVALGDFSGDGLLDLAVANRNSDTVSMLLGQGAGALGAPTDYTSDLYPTSLAAGDLNGDGKLDLAAANYGTQFGLSSVAVLLNQGAGVLDAATYYTVGLLPLGVAIGDLSGDGLLDLAVANSGSNNVSVLLGQGGGVFGAATDYPIGSVPSSVAIGELSGDDELDLAVTNSGSNTVSVLLGQGGGVLGAPTNFGVGSGPSFVAIAELSGDDELDLAVANLDSKNVSVLLGQGGGLFGGAMNHGVGLGPSSIAVADLNGDETPDLAVANSDLYSQVVSVLLGEGGGAFGAKTEYALQRSPCSVAAGDLTGDGKLDLAVANSQAATVSVMPNLGPYGGPWINLNFGLAGASGIPILLGTGPLTAGSPGTLLLSDAAPSAVAILFGSLASTPTAFKCGTLVPVPLGSQLPVVTSGSGTVALGWASLPASVSGSSLYLQYAVQDAGAVCGVALSNALRADVP